MGLDIDRMFDESPDGEISFVIESYPPGADFDSNDKDLCKKNSNPNFQHFIELCKGNSIVRMLTDQEKLQIQQYKDQQKGRTLLC